jgi:outer membrane biosynthesis protein TonB
LAIENDENLSEADRPTRYRVVVLTPSARSKSGSTSALGSARSSNELTTMKRIILTVPFMFLVAAFFASTYAAQSVSRGRKPSSKQLALVESSCSKGNLNQVALRMGIGNYPAKAWRRHVGGKVTVKVYINESGDVYHAVPIDGPKLLRASAARAASWSRFVPFEANGLPVKCAGLLVYNFVAQ